MKVCDVLAGESEYRAYRITSIQLSITLASIFFKTLSDLVTSLKKVKSNTTVPYIELLICVPAKPTSDVGTSCRLDRARCAPATVPPCCCSSNHFATSLCRQRSGHVHDSRGLHDHHVLHHDRVDRCRVVAPHCHPYRCDDMEKVQRLLLMISAVLLYHLINILSRA